ncbi:AEC family transporter [Methylicorpusculum oleiharenae]|uniref:AEC family transporter n=1 Tax=Methylicorpusculum oleiharenae TaxID=1338687 RepID=UPI00135CDDEE|nr:AEC family transporter [Methylicorpusculum oleiharenae]MCD2451261.1 AEC family transporter [Methylicorpusculum oleiharenae]
MYFDQLFFAVNVTGPTLLILSMGWLFRKIELIDDHFIAVGNKIVFNVTLPCLLFFGTVSTPLSESLDGPLILFAAVVTVIIVGLLWLASALFVTREKRGVFVQGAFRGNMGVMGIALVLNAYGQQILSKASIYLALMTVLYNVLAVLVLRTDKASYWLSLLKNPLVLAVLLGITGSYLAVDIPEIVANSGHYFSQMTLPLALLCTGGSLHWDSFKANHKEVIWASIFKLVIVPAIVTVMAIGWGFRAQELGLLFLMMSVPCASASFVMAKQMTRHGAMAAEIIALTTIGSALSITAGLLLLKYQGYI